MLLLKKLTLRLEASSKQHTITLMDHAQILHRSLLGEKCIIHILQMRYNYSPEVSTRKLDAKPIKGFELAESTH